MALSVCTPTATDPQRRELQEHGSALFPIACYHDDIQAMAVDWHWHEELELLVVECGTARVAVNGQEYLLPAGSGGFINAGALHGVWNHGTGACRLRSIVFHPKLVGGSRESIFWANYLTPLLADPGMGWVRLSPDTDWEAEVIARIQECWEACVEEAGGFEFTVRELLSRIVLLLSQSCAVSRQTLPEKARRDNLRAKTMLRLLQTHWSEPLTLGQIAQSAAVSSNECLRCFRSILGISPIRYLNQLRIQQAAQLLLSSPRRICDIAAECGFQEMSYFAKVFREQTGCTPSQYRLRYQGGKETVKTSG